MANLWIILILPAIALAADQQQRTTVSFPSNAGVSPQQQQQQPMSNGVNMQPGQGNVGVNIADPSYNANGANNNPNMAAYYRNLDLQGGQGAVYPPEVPNFYFNAGFNKGLGFRMPDALTGAGYYGAGQHTPLGDLWAVKAELLPAIFKTGFFITAIIAILKIIVFLIQAKHNFLVSGPLAAPVPAPAVVPIQVIADRSSSAPAKDDASRVKRDASGSPAVDSQADFDHILAQLETIRSRFEHSLN